MQPTWSAPVPAIEDTGAPSKMSGVAFRVSPGQPCYFRATRARQTQWSMEGNLVHAQDKEKRMRLRRMIVMLAVAASLSFGLPSAVSAAYATSAAPAAHLVARAPAAAQAASTSTTQTSKAIPLIQFRDCQGQVTTWVDIDILFSGGGLYDWCFGYKGIWTFSRSYEVSNFCAGNNEGHFSYYLPDGQLTGFTFLPGTKREFPGGSHPYQLNITGWSGKYTCNS
jgi:hypothetical protein